MVFVSGALPGERVLAEDPALAGDEAAMERRMVELNNLRLLDARINFDEELDGPILALGEVRVGEESAPVYKVYPSGNPTAIFYTDSPQAEYAVDPDGELRSVHVYPGGTITVRYRVFKQNTEPEIQQRLCELASKGLLAEELLCSPAAKYRPVCFMDVDREKIKSNIWK